MFVFREPHYADRFEERCVEEDIAFERHEEGGEVMFGVAKTSFTEALRANHLVYAEFRSHFIPHKGWRWGLLVLTSAVLGLALMGWLTSTTAHGQVEAGLPWELDVLARMHVPVGALGMEATQVEGQGIDAVWTPRVGSDLGLRIHRRLKDGWTLGGGGVDSPRTRHCGGLQQRFAGIERPGHLATDAQFGLSHPHSGGIRIPLGWNDLEVQSSLGLPLNGRRARPW